MACWFVFFFRFSFGLCRHTLEKFNNAETLQYLMRRVMFFRTKGMFIKNIVNAKLYPLLCTETMQTTTLHHSHTHSRTHVRS